MSEEPGREGESEVPWLRDMVDDEILGLFSDEQKEVRRTARRILEQAESDPAILERLIETLRTSIRHQNDETQASAWIALILGEIGDLSALPVLFQGLGGEDETVQEASRDAILRIGPPAIEALLDAIDEEPAPDMIDAGYRLLGWVGTFKDPALRARAVDFLAERVERELAKPRGECRIESLFQASALLGDRRMLETMDRILRTRFGGKNSAIQDSRDMLSENLRGEPLAYDRPPWIEEHRWLFEEDLESARIRHRGPGRILDDESPPDARASDVEENPEERNLSALYWGLNATAERDDMDPIDARRFLGHPQRDRSLDDAEEEEEIEGSETFEDREEEPDRDEDE